MRYHPDLQPAAIPEHAGPPLRPVPPAFSCMAGGRPNLILFAPDIDYRAYRALQLAQDRTWIDVAVEHLQSLRMFGEVKQSAPDSR